MTNPTSNFGWQMPTSTDLVTDLPADFEVFGQAVDTDFVDLLGGTTGQVLSKTSATDLDFTWVTANPGDITGVTAGTGISGGGTSGTVTVTNDMATTITASGDIVVGTGSGTYDNLPIGTTAQILTADTTVSPYKVKWATPAAAASGFTFITRSTATAVATLTIDSIFTSTYDTYLVVMEDMINSAGGILYLQMRYGSSTETSANYLGTSTTWASSSQQNLNSSSVTQSSVQTMHAGQKTSVSVYFNQVGNASESPMWHGTGLSGGLNVPYVYGCVLYAARTYTGIFLSSSTGNMTGTFSIYGLAKA